MLNNALILIGLSLLVACLYHLFIILKRPKQHHILTPTPSSNDDAEDSDFVCLHLGSKGTIVSSGDDTVRSTRISAANNTQNFIK